VSCQVIQLPNSLSHPGPGIIVETKGIMVMMFIATFNNISILSWQFCSSEITLYVKKNFHDVLCTEIQHIDSAIQKNSSVKEKDILVIQLERQQSLQVSIRKLYKHIYTLPYINVFPFHSPLF